MAGEQLKRLAFAAVAIPIVLGIVWYGGLPLVALLSVTGVLAIRELFTFAELAGEPQAAEAASPPHTSRSLAS